MDDEELFAQQLEAAVNKRTEVVTSSTPTISPLSYPECFAGKANEALNE